MQRITTVLTPEELCDKNLVKNYLETSFKISRTEKDKKLYINISLIFKKYPIIIKNIINNIQTFGYHKDYFHILMHSMDTELDAYIYDIVVRIIKNDIENLQMNKQISKPQKNKNDIKNHQIKKQISTLGKYLPREQSPINLKCNFIDKFNALFFPKIKNRTMARRVYRQMKTNLNIEIGTIEVRLCTKTLDKIEYDKVTPHALKKLTPRLLAHEQSKDKFEEFIFNKLKKMTLGAFMNEIIKGKHSLHIIEKVWVQNTFSKFYSLDKIITDSICIIDLSRDTYETNNAYVAIGIALLVNQHSTVPKNVIVGKEILELQGNIIENTEHIMRHVGPCEIDINAVHGDAHNIIVVTSKEIPVNDFMNVTHIKTVEHGFHIFLPHTRPILKHVVHVNKEIVKRNIKFFTNNSDELLDKKSPIIFLFCIIMLLSIVHLTNPRFNIIL